MKSALTAARLRELLHYDRNTGIFTWRVRRSRYALVGSVAGHTNLKGYRVIEVDGKKYLAHRIAWLYVTGAWPVDEIDHEDTDKANNRFANLRPADNRLNAENKRRAQSNSRLGLLGVNEAHGVFLARICIKGKSLHLGTFATPEAAHAAYVEAKRVLHAGCTL